MHLGLMHLRLMHLRLIDFPVLRAIKARVVCFSSHQSAR